MHYLFKQGVVDGIMVVDVDADWVESIERLVVILFLVVKNVTLDNKLLVVLVT